MDGPLWFGTYKTSEHTAVPESTELTHGSIQEFPITLMGKRVKISKEKGNISFHYLVFFGRRFSGLGKVRL